MTSAGPTPRPPSANRSPPATGSERCGRGAARRHADGAGRPTPAAHRRTAPRTAPPGELPAEPPRRAVELAAELATTPSAMSKHLRVLRQCGLVTETHPDFDAR